MATITDDWFVAEVLVYEAALTRFLRRHWREAAEIADLRQEVYVRVYEAARTNPPQHPRAFLFATARNLMSDRIRRGRIVSMEAVADFEKSNVLLIEDWTPEHQESSRQELQRLAQALDCLPPRCREVLWMRRVKGLSQKEVAAALGIAESTVEKQVAKGVRLLADSLRGDTVAPQTTAPAAADGAGKMYD